ncbi:YceK/YidQ family lipoprotein [Methylococcus geothermalis]|uniref:YceK/YidQ family lipoprotein n=1 Tax=Methylococcus geothermalis TaxID=2681310 RepID=A0A858Q4H6_9GAMM|nr:YceK/YidQ family lipoprotein [Methylococcus geothermalis]QJD28739.1 YceK/YidQ family lipoprotein [Methylococcus geothermalis]
MNTKRRLAVALILIATLASGCASIRARTDVLPRKGWTVYPGARQGMTDIDAAVNGKLPYPGWMHVLLFPAFVLDLPVGAVFDTLALPYDLYRINHPEDFPKGKRK